jgi:hypothetical protein
VTQQRADRPTRRSSSVSRRVLDGTTANSLAVDHHGPLQDGQAVKTKLLTGDCLRGLDQGLWSTRARCSKNRPPETLCIMAGLTQGWAGHSCHIRRMPFTSTGAPALDVDALYFRQFLSSYVLNWFQQTHIALHLQENHHEYGRPFPNSAP